MKTLHRITLMLMLTVALCGCHWEDDDFLGTWESYAYFDGYDEFELTMSERAVYSFYNDGTGMYTQYHPHFTTDFYWSERSYGHLYLRHSDGATEDFYYRFDHGDMLVSGSPSFHEYTVFAYTGRHR